MNSKDSYIKYLEFIFDKNNESEKNNALNSVELRKEKQNGKYGFKNKAGKIVIPCIYNEGDNFSEGLASVEQNGKWGYIDKMGKLVIPLIYDEADYFSEGLASVKQNGKWGYIDKTGKLVLPFIYDDAYSFSEGLAKVKQNGKWGYIDKTGKLVFPFIYDYAYSFSEGLALVKQNDKYGYIDKIGNLFYKTKDIFSNAVTKIHFVDGNVIKLKGKIIKSFGKYVLFKKENNIYYLYNMEEQKREMYLDISSDMKVHGKFITNKKDKTYYIDDRIIDLKGFNCASYSSTLRNGYKLLTYDEFIYSEDIKVLLIKIKERMDILKYLKDVQSSNIDNLIKVKNQYVDMVIIKIQELIVKYPEYTDDLDKILKEVLLLKNNDVNNEEGLDNSLEKYQVLEKVLK